MLIKEVCARCGLTKKAVEYYEGKELIHPRTLENGYRDYSEEDLSALKEISVLRKCGIGIGDIGQILASANKPAALAKAQYKTRLAQKRLEQAQERIDRLIARYDVNREFDVLQSAQDGMYTIREKLLFAFPGNYGLYITLHFGRFLNGVIETLQQRQAYEAIVGYLDNIKLLLPEALAQHLEKLFSENEAGDAVRVEEEVNKSMQTMLADPDAYLEQNREVIEQYLEFKASEAYQTSEAGEVQKLMMDFQKQSGYKEIFIANMKILSPGYAAYMDMLEAANARMLEKYPAAAALYEQQS